MSRQAITPVLGVALITIAFVALTPSLGYAQAMDQHSCEEGLRNLYPALTEYRELTGQLPGELIDLYREAFVDDPMIFFIEGTAEYGLAQQWPDLATPSFELLHDDPQGRIAVCGPLTGQTAVYLLSDGTARDEHAAYVRLLGSWQQGPLQTVYEATEEYLKRPIARLGVILEEFPTNKAHNAVVVTGILPGYASGLSPGQVPEFRPRDRLVRLNGYRPEGLDDLDRVVSLVDNGEPYWGTVIRSERLFEARQPRSLFDQTAMRRLPNPELVVQAAAVHLSQDGPGFFGVDTNDHPQGAEVTRVVPGSAAEQAGLRTSDVITAIEANPVSDTWDFRDRVRTYGAGLTIEIEFQRGNASRTVLARLGSLNPLELELWRYRLHAGQLNVVKALPFATQVPTVGQSEVVELIRYGHSDEEALSWLDDRLRQEPEGMGRGMLLLQRAQVRRDLAMWDESLEDLNTALHHHPDPAAVLERMATTLWEIEERDEAIQALQKAVEQSDTDSQRNLLLLELARRLVSIGEQAEAERVLEPLLRDPTWEASAREVLRQERPD